MSLHVTSMVWRHAPVADQASLLVLLALADWADDEGRCWPSVSSIAMKARMSERNVRYVITKLRDDDLIEIDGGKGGRAQTNLYRITMRRLQGKPPSVEQPDLILESERLQPLQGLEGPETLQNPSKPCKIPPLNPATAIAAERLGTVSTERLDVSIPENLKTPEFLVAWSEWLADRKERKKPVTSRAARMQLDDLALMGPELAVKSIKQSIANRWQGLFPVLKNDHHNRQNGGQGSRRAALTGDYSDAGF